MYKISSSSAVYSRQRSALDRTLVRYFLSTREKNPAKTTIALHELKQLLASFNMVLAGGAITGIFTGAKVNDLDFYMKDKSVMDHVLTLFSSYGYEVKNTTENAVTLIREFDKRRTSVQLITRFSGEPETVFKTFDFTCVCGAFDFNRLEFILHERFFLDNMNKRLVYTGGSAYPICALHRTRKYQDRGYYLPGGTIIRIALDIVRLEITTYAELKSHLMGVDTLFLADFFEKKAGQDDRLINYDEFLDHLFSVLDTVEDDVSE